MGKIGYIGGLKVRRINLKWILLNQLKWIPVELFKIFQRQYQPTQLWLRTDFSTPTQVSFFLFVQVIVWAQVITCISCQSQIILYLSIILPCLSSERQLNTLHWKRTTIFLEKFEKSFDDCLQCFTTYFQWISMQNVFK